MMLDNDERPWTAPIDPIDFGAGHVLPLPGGQTIWRFDPQHGPSAAVLERYVQALRDLGHTVVVGDQGALARAAVEALNL